MAKRCVFRRRLKVPSVSDAVTLGSKVFQVRGAATKNARSPIVVRYEDGVTRADVDEDRSLFLVSTSATRRSSLARYGGPCRRRKTRTESLNTIRSGTRSQWRSVKYYLVTVDIVGPSSSRFNGGLWNMRYIAYVLYYYTIGLLLKFV